MPSNMNTLSSDISVELVTPQGPLNIQPEAITNWTARRVSAMSSRRGIGGKPRHRTRPGGWEGSFTIDRFDDTIERYFADLDAAYYRGENTFGGTIQETVANPDGSISQWRYTGVAFNLTEIGARDAEDDVITLTLEFSASDRVPVL